MIRTVGKKLSTSIFGLAVCFLGASIAHATVLVSEDFESYADTAAMQAVWNEAPGGLGTLDTAQGNPGQSMAHSGGTTSNLLFTATIPTDSAPLIWEFDFFDDGNTNKRITGGLRDNGGGSGLNSILEMGRYNSAIDPSTGASIDGYAVRTVFINGSPGNWATFVGIPAVVQGWHHFKATIGASSILFELDLGDDGTFDAMRQITTSAGAGIAYNVARFGGPSNLSSAGGGGNFDNLQIAQVNEQVPAPATLTLLGLGLAGIGYQRRKQVKAA